MADELTLRQREVLHLFITAARNCEPPPTLREIQAKFGWSSITAANDHTRALIKKGWLDHPVKGRSRGLVLTDHARRVWLLPPRRAA